MRLHPLRPRGDDHRAGRQGSPGLVVGTDIRGWHAGSGFACGRTIAANLLKTRRLGRRLRARSQLSRRQSLRRPLLRPRARLASSRTCTGLSSASHSPGSPRMLRHRRALPAAPGGLQCDCSARWTIRIAWSRGGPARRQRPPRTTCSRRSRAAGLADGDGLARRARESVVRQFHR